MIFYIRVYYYNESDKTGRPRKLIYKALSLRKNDEKVVFQDSYTGKVVQLDISDMQTNSNGNIILYSQTTDAN
jgi:hypothetical protein